jgi:DNA mismatch endonuclease (patch repair protein)
VDCFSPEQRSALMSRVRQKDTKPEVLLRKALWARGIRYRKQQKVDGVRPDLVIKRFSLAIFVDGCFWHGCPTHYTSPASNATFWQNKIEKNRRRDQMNNQNLAAKGWTILRIWECEIETDLDRAVQKILDAISYSPKGAKANRTHTHRPDKNLTGGSLR